MINNFLREHGVKGEQSRGSRSARKGKRDGLEAKPDKTATNTTALPAWTEPGGLKQARSIITKLGRDVHEHAYILGRALTWVKGEVGHGKFLTWLVENVWFSPDTAERMMGFSKRCLQAGKIVEYQPSKIRTVRITKLQSPQKHSNYDISGDNPKTEDFGGAGSPELPGNPGPDEPLSDEPCLVPSSAEDVPLPPEEAEPAGLERFDFIEPPIDPEEAVIPEQDEPLTGDLLCRCVERMIRQGFSRLPVGEQSQFIQRIVALVNDLETELEL